MSLPSLSNPGAGGPYRKPRADLYTMFLLIALAAIIIGIVCLYLDAQDYPSSPPYKDAPSPAVMLDAARPAALALAAPPSAGLDHRGISPGWPPGVGGA